MKLREVLDFVDKMKPGNPYDTATKIQWLNELEGDIQSHLLNTAPQEIIQYTESDMDATLLIPAPFDRVYWPWVAAMIDFANGEYSKYQNTLQLVNDAYDKYAKWFHRKFHEDTGGFLFIGGTTKYGLSAYEIAANHGFKGTEEEWLDSLVGEIGPPGPVGAGLNIKGQVGTEAQLPTLDDADEGTAYLVGTGVEALLYIWDGSAWFYKQPLSVKGGDFTYEDFTPEQLELLRGPRGYQGEPVNVERVLESPDDGGINTVFFTDGKQLQVRNGTKGKDGITPHIGANGNWYLGETDTGVKAQGDDGVGITDIQKRTAAGREVLYIILSDGTEKGFALPVPENGEDYVLTDADKTEIAEQAAKLVDIPDSAENVKNVRSYGATGDGVTDDTAAIDAAIEDLGTGETLYFPAGVYRVSKVDLKSDMTVQGNGWCSVIKLIDNAPDDYTNCLDIEGEENVIIRDIKLDGSRWTNGGYTQSTAEGSKDYRLNGIRIRASSNIRIENVWMHNNGYHGCVMTKSRNVVIDRCKVTDNGFRPIHGNTQVFNCQITNCVCENNGLGLQGGSGALNDSIFFFGVRDLAITNNIIKSNRRGCITVGTDQYGMADEDLTESGNITITGNVCECYEDLPYVSSGESDTGVVKDPSMGIAVYGSSRYKLESVTVTGNTILRANRAFYIYSQEIGTLATINAAVTGNTVKDCSYGIYAQDVSGVVCSGNQFRGLTVNWIYGKAIEDCQFSGNLVYAMDINQVCRMYNSKNVVLQSNDIIGNQAYAIYIPASNTGCVVTGNTMYGFTLDNPVSNPNGTTANNVPGTMGGDYVLTDADKQEIAELAADLVDVPEVSGGGYVAQDTAPEDTTLLWVDTSDDSDDNYQEAVNAALAQAKASGEFDGKNGDDYVLTDTDRTEIAEQAAQMVIDDAPVKSVNGKTGAVTLAATDVGARPSTWTPSATDVGADPKGTANTAVTTHNVATDAHNDMRLLIDGLTSRLNALANSTDEDLDQMAEMVAYIKENRELISGITTNKVNVADIINNLTTNVSNKPLSAAQGVALKALIDAITVPTKLSQLTNDKGYITGYTETDPTVPSWAKATSKPSYSKSEVGLGNVDNVKQYSANNPPPYPVTSVNGKTGAVTVDVPSVPSWAMATSKPSYTASEVGAVPTSRTVNGKALSANISLSASDVGARASTWTPSAAEIKSALGYTPANQATTITITGKDADGNTHTFTVVGWEA